MHQCPRCTSLLHSNYDPYGPYIECLACGYVRDVQPPVDDTKLYAEDAPGVKKKRAAHRRAAQRRAAAKQ